MDYFDQIEEYLNNTLSESEMIAFEAEMAKDDKLRQAVEDHGAAMDVIGSILEGEVRKVIVESEKLKVESGGEEIDNGREIIDNGQLIIDNEVRDVDNRKLLSAQEVTGDKVKVKGINWLRWGAAAAVVFVMGWWGMNEFGGNNNSKLYASTYSDPAWQMERGDETTDISKSIIKYFNNSKDDAKSELKSIATPEANYWLAEIYYKEMKFDSTLLFIPKEIAVDKNRRDRINYLEILSLYFIGDVTEAENAILNSPKNTDTYYFQIFSKLDF